jgi:two-component system, chemotaxis family, CheB/CheR fusion protein
VPDDEPSPEFEALLQYLKQSRGFDFTGYKRASVQRRIDKRMRAVGVPEYDEYVEYLEVHPHEFVELFNTILINVTGFYRDASAWQYLRDEVLPAHLARLDDNAPIRAWSAGCASGEEAYSLAIVLAEILGIDEFRRRVKIYGTDIDEDALQTARQATYSDRELAGLTPELRSKYFEGGGGRYTFRSDLRRSVIFGRIDILHDAPISRLELLMCRNTLMYLNAETQAQVLARFHFALNSNGILVLGKAETLLSDSTLFEAIDRRRRVFRKVAVTAHPRDGDRFSGATGGDELAESLTGAAVDASPLSMLLVDREGFLVRTNEHARRSFGLNLRDHGRPFQDLEVSSRPVELRTPIEQARTERRTVVVRAAEWHTRGSAHVVDVEVSPLFVEGEFRGVVVVFLEVTEQRELEEQLRQSNLELERVYEEVQSTNEELETTNEELQSTIEELETTNEELQSTNEELETMNKELQSTNDELHTVNEEVRIRGDEVDELNRFLSAILTSFGGGVVVVGPDRKVRLWNTRAEDLWGLREEEVRGLDFMAIDSGLPVQEVGPTLDACLAHEIDRAELSVDAVNRRGRHIRCLVSVNPLRGEDGDRGALIVMRDEAPA